MELTIVFDNQPFSPELQTSWGFSCFIKGLDQTILFDTGSQGEILLSNMNKLNIQPQDIDVVFLSHAHKDHTGGLSQLLDLNSDAEVWLPEFFPPDLKKSVRNRGATVVEVENFRKICEGAFTSGVIQGWIKEQSLMLDSPQGIVVITGCAHPRIVRILSTVKNLLSKNIYLALGGFHLAGFEDREIKEIIENFRSLGVKKVAPSHCSGQEARELFSQAYQNDFISSGLGKRIKIQ